MLHRRIPRLLASLALFSALFPLGVSAHPIDYGAMTTVMRAEGNRIEFRSEVPATAVELALTPSYPEELKLGFYEKLFVRSLRVSLGGAECPLKLDSFRAGAEWYLFDGSLECPGGFAIDELAIRNSLFETEFERFDHFLSLSSGDARWDIVFGRDRSDFPATASAKESSWLHYATAAALRFFWLGVRHIFEGYDHILFLLSLILLMRSKKRIALLASSFTLAHSATLVLAGLGIVTLSPRVVEPLIALSVAYVSLRNLLTLRKEDGERKGERAFTSFAFGLVHGLGFAGALAETRIPHDFFVPSLLVFNIGIEIGQLAILAVAYVVLKRFDRLPSSKKAYLIVSWLAFGFSLLVFLSRL